MAAAGFMVSLGWCYTGLLATTTTTTIEDPAWSRIGRFTGKLFGIWRTKRLESCYEKFP